MGQYYRGVILKKENKKTVKAFVRSYDYNNGAKLMEHSWCGNKYVNALEILILANPQRVVWAGGYADEDKGYKSNLFGRCDDKKKVNPPNTDEVISAKYVVNHTKKVFVDKSKISRDNWNMRIHPLPLLTVEGNGRGGGDYHFDEEKPTESEKMIGAWARDLISIEYEKPKGFKELEFDLVDK